VRLMHRVLGSVTALALVLTACTGDDGSSADQGLPTEPFELGLDVGDCFDRPQSPDVTSVPTIDCAEPHDFEAYAVVDLEGDAFPGVEEVDGLARDACTERFADYVGVPAGQSGLVIVPVVPTAEHWEADLREVTCTVTIRPPEKLESTVEGSEQSG
jgi:hypothetical protein